MPPLQQSRSRSNVRCAFPHQLPRNVDDPSGIDRVTRRCADCATVGDCSCCSDQQRRAIHELASDSCIGYCETADCAVRVSPKALTEFSRIQRRQYHPVQAEGPGSSSERTPASSSAGTGQRRRSRPLPESTSPTMCAASAAELALSFVSSEARRRSSVRSLIFRSLAIARLGIP